MQATKNPKAAKAEVKSKEMVEPVTPPAQVVQTKAPAEDTPSAPVDLAIVEPAKIENGQLVLSSKHLELIKSQIAPTATPQELDLFIMMARRTRLDPLMKQLYFIKYAGKVAYITSIDGYRIIAHRTNDFAGIDEPKFGIDPVSKRLSHCTITVYKLVQGVRCGFSATVKFSEYSTNQNNWTKMPETMIAKVAEAHALRKAFPNDLQGLYIQDEMDQAGRPSTAPAKMMTRTQWVEIQRLMTQKGFGVEDLKAHVAKAYRLTTMQKVTDVQANEIIAVLQKEKDKDDFMQPPADSSQVVDVDDIPDDLGEAKPEEPVAAATQPPDPVVPPTAGDVALFESALRKRAGQLGKPYEAMYEAYLNKLGIIGLQSLPGDEVRKVTDKIIELNKAHEPAPVVPGPETNFEDTTAIFMPPPLPQPVQEELA